MYGIQKSVTTNQDDFILQLFGLWNYFLNKKCYYQFYILCEK